jgi:ABC-2 type transport system permease protein
MKAFGHLFLAELRIFMRDKLTLFLAFLFPLMFILVFGFVMGGRGGAAWSANMGAVVSVGPDSKALNDVLSSTSSIHVARFRDQASLESALGKRGVDLGLVWDGEKLLFLYDPSRVQENYAFEQVAQGITTDFTLRRQGLRPLFSVDKVHVGKKAATNWFNVVVPGILAFTILSAGLFSVSGHLTAMKERKILDRLAVTPMPPAALLAAVVCVRLLSVYVATLITLFVSVAVFRLTFDVNWLRYTIFVAASTVGMMGFGTFITLVVRRPSSASNLSTILSLVMMFLSGVYFPIELLPSILRAVSRLFPLTYMTEGMRYVTGVADMSLLRFWVVTAAFVGMAAVLLPLLARYVVTADRR